MAAGVRVDRIGLQCATRVDDQGARAAFTAVPAFERVALSLRVGD